LKNPHPELFVEMTLT